MYSEPDFEEFAQSVDVAQIASYFTVVFMLSREDVEASLVELIDGLL